MASYGKDSFAAEALKGGSGASNGIDTAKIDRPNQSIMTAFPMDNVKLAQPMETSLRDKSFRGGITNLGHSLNGASAVQSDVGAAGPVKKTIFPDH